MTPDIQFVAPLHIVLPISVGQGAEPLDIGPLRVSQVLKIIGTVNTLIDDVNCAPPEVHVVLFGSGIASDHDRKVFMRWMSGFLELRPDEICHLVSVASGLTQSAINDLLPDQMIATILAIIEVNLDFFCRCVPLLEARIARIGKAAQGATSSGLTPSSSSSTPGTATPTS